MNPQTRQHHDRSWRNSLGGWIVIMSFGITCLAALFSGKSLQFTPNPHYFFPISNQSLGPLQYKHIQPTYQNVPLIRYKRVCSASHESQWWFLWFTCSWCHPTQQVISKSNQGFSVLGISLPSGNDWSRWGTEWVDSIRDRRVRPE